MKNQPTPLKQLMMQLIKKNGWNDIYLQSHIKSIWGEVYNERLPQVSEIIRVENAKLYVKCSNSTWKFELQHRKEQIMKSINEKFGFDAIKDIFFQ